VKIGKLVTATNKQAFVCVEGGTISLSGVLSLNEPLEQYSGSSFMWRFGCNYS